MALRLTKKAEPPPTRGVNRDSGTDSANGGWLRRLVRRRRHIQAGLTNAAVALTHRMIPAPTHPTGLVGPALDIKG